MSSCPGLLALTRDLYPQIVEWNQEYDGTLFFKQMAPDHSYGRWMQEKDIPASLKPIIEEWKESKFMRGHDPELDKLKSIKGCIHCGNPVNPKIPFALTCGKKCEEKRNAKIEQMEKELYEHKCINCGLNYRSQNPTRVKSICDGCKKQAARKESETRQKPRKELFINGIKRGRLLPYHVLNEIMEKQRVFDQKGWDRYERGKKYDAI